MMDERQRRRVAAALDHDWNGDLPRVVASGRGTVADRILELAFATGVKVREDADLAELLVAADLGSEIPAEAMIAVAEIIARLYAENARLATGHAG